jgi:hypothetical protein
MTSNEKKLMDALKSMAMRLKSEQVKTFKNDIAIKVLTDGIADLKAQLKKVKSSPQQSSFDTTKFLQEINDNAQAQLNISDVEIKQEIQRWKQYFSDVKPKINS